MHARNAAMMLHGVGLSVEQKRRNGRVTNVPLRQFVPILYDIAPVTPNDKQKAHPDLPACQSMKPAVCM